MLPALSFEFPANILKCVCSDISRRIKIQVAVSAVLGKSVQRDHGCLEAGRPARSLADIEYIYNKSVARLPTPWLLSLSPVTFSGSRPPAKMTRNPESFAPLTGQCCCPGGLWVPPGQAETLYINEYNNEQRIDPVFFCLFCSLSARSRIRNGSGESRYIAVGNSSAFIYHHCRMSVYMVLH